MRKSKSHYHHAVRRLKRSQNHILNDKLINAVKDGGVNIFDEVKRHRGIVKTGSTTVDGEVGAANIAEHFAGTYSELYSRVQLGPEFDSLGDQVRSKIDNNTSQADIERINEDLIKEAIRKLKSGKSDALYDYSSDVFINGPPELVTHLTNMIKSFVVHGSVPYFLLLCTLVPIVKDPLGDIQSSANYRAIAISSLVMKLMDWVILLGLSQSTQTD